MTDTTPGTPPVDPLDVPFPTMQTWDMIDVGPHKHQGRVRAVNPRAILLGCIPHFSPSERDKLQLFIDDKEGSVILGNETVGKLKRASKDGLWF
jgi:hypothetical protein